MCVSNSFIKCIASWRQLLHALELAHLSEMLAELDGGLDAKVSEKGANFSLGQVQLLCLARVLLKQPVLVLMDEATASVDLKTDDLVQQTVRAALSATLITIAHRLSTIIDYDKVAVIEDGNVAEVDTPHALLCSEGSRFSGLVDATGEQSATELRKRAKDAASKAAQPPTASAAPAAEPGLERAPLPAGDGEVVVEQVPRVSSRGDYENELYA